MLFTKICKNFQVRLISSVPGYHTGSNLTKWGHMKLRTILQECIFEREFRRSPLVYQVVFHSKLFFFSFSATASHAKKSSFTKKFVLQFSSLGSLDEKWLTEFGTSLSSGITEDKTPLGPGDPLIIWPTVEDVRCSLEVTLTKFLKDYIFSLYVIDFSSKPLNLQTKGYAAGNAIPSPLKNVEKPFLKKYWAKWKANHSARR